MSVDHGIRTPASGVIPLEEQLQYHLSAAKRLMAEIAERDGGELHSVLLNGIFISVTGNMEISGDPALDEFLYQLNASPKYAFEALRSWGEEKFGPVTPERIIERAWEEFEKELRPIVKGKTEWDDKMLEEMADVFVIFTRAPGFWDAVVRKMTINFGRTWNVKGDGTGYHIPQE
jgi:hypothetical protein